MTVEQMRDDLSEARRYARTDPDDEPKGGGDDE
jgi:hypothetical protein